MIAFEQASYFVKVRRLRGLAEECLKAYPLKIKSIEFIKLTANAIFKIRDTRGKQYQLRIHPEVYHSKQAILEELKWLHHLLKTTDITVPKPVCTIEGQYVIRCNTPSLSGARFCDLFEWLPGRRQWKSIHRQYAYNLGAVIAQLQKNGQDIKIKHRHYWNADGLVGTDKAKFYNIEKLKNISTNDQTIITAARRVTYQKLKAYETLHKDKSGLIHGDMQPNNILVHKNDFSVIDFDDCGTGLYGDDLATALFAFEYVAQGDKRKRFLELKNALFEGYSQYMPLSQEDISLSPYFLLARKLVTIAWLEIRRDNPNLEPYFKIAIKRAIAFYEKLKK